MSSSVMVWILSLLAAVLFTALGIVIQRLITKHGSLSLVPEAAPEAAGGVSQPESSDEVTLDQSFDSTGGVREDELSTLIDVSRRTARPAVDSEGTAASVSQGSVTDQADALQKLRQMEFRLHASERRAEEAERLEREASELREQLEALKSSEAAALELMDLRKQHERLRVDYEVACRHNDVLSELAEQVAPLKAQLKYASQEAAEAGQLRKRLQRTESLLLATETQYPLPRGRGNTGVAVDPDSLLGYLSSYARAVVLSDSGGLLVEAVGDEAYFEPLAASAGLADRFEARFADLLPFTDSRYLQLQERSGASWICCRIPGRDNLRLAALGSDKLLKPEIWSGLWRQLEAADRDAGD